MDIEPPFESDLQLSKPSKPSMRVLYNPAVFAQPLTAFDASPCNPAQDAFDLQIAPTTAVVIALVSMQFPGALAPLTKTTSGMP